MNVFETVKGAVTTREAAGMYGIEVKRNGMAVCPFHDDHNPSMKVDKRFHCFGCGEDGDVIDFTSRLYNLSPKEAAEKLAQDFGLVYDSHTPVKRQYIRQKTDAQIWKEKEHRCFLALADYFHQLREWETEYAPSAQDEELNDLFVEAVQKKDYVEYLLDVLISGSAEEKKALIADYENEIKKIEQRRSFSMPEKISNKDRLRQITENIEAGIKELFESDKYRQYLSTMSRFHRYSVNNTMLIYLQKPDATLVAGFNKWKNQFERHVKKGEHGITIIAPTPFKKKIEEQKLDPDTKAPVLDKNGKIVTEEKEVEIPMFRPVKVFDVSQTDGKPLPQLASDLAGNVQQYDAFMEALRRTSPVPVAIQSIHDGSDGYFSLTDQRIAIREGMSEVQTVSATVHEIAHSILHNNMMLETPLLGESYQEVEVFGKPALFSNGRVDRTKLPEGLYCYDLRGSDDDPGDPITIQEKVIVNHAATVITAEPVELPEAGFLYLGDDGLNFTGGNITLREFYEQVKPELVNKNRNTQEVEAESISYAVCQYYGIQTGENSFGYIATWSKDKELSELKASLETINKTASGLITDIDRHFKEICKERGIDLTAEKEPQIDPVIILAADIDKFSLEFDPYEYQDQVSDREQALSELTASIAGGKIQPVCDWLQAIIEERGEFAQEAERLLERLKAFIPDFKEQNQLTYYVAECMEFPSLGEYHENLSLQDAIRLYEAIPAERMNGIKGIGFELHDDSDYAGTFPILNGKTVDLDSINSIAYFRDNEQVQKAVSDLMEAMPEMEVIQPFVPQQDEEALFLVDDANYLHIQTSDEGYDYTIYDAKTQREVDGGCLANPDISLLEARKEIFAIHGMPAEQIEAADLSLVEELQDAQPMPAPRRYAMDENAEVRRTWNGKLPEQFAEEDTKAFMAETAAMLGMDANVQPQTTSMLPETPEQALDEYPMPDTGLTQADIEKTGYLDGDMLPLSKEMAETLLEKDFTVYAIVDGGSAEMLFDMEELEIQPAGTLFAMSREEWEGSPDFDKAIQDRLNHQEEREAAFLSHDGDCFAIYQVKNTDELRDIRFEGMDWLKSIDRTVERENYDLIYTAPLQKTDGADAALGELWYKFNNEHPADYHSPSMSVSDIVVLKQSGEVSCHYVDSFGFAPVPDFIKPENYLKAAEISIEDDYGMIDGIINNGPKQPTVADLEQQSRSGQPISLMDLADAVHREQREKKKSVMEQLKTQPTQEPKKTAPKRSAEREL